MRVARAVDAGVLPHVSALACWECGARAQVYVQKPDRDDANALDVKPSCRPCISRRRAFRGTRVPGAKLTDEKVRSIRALAAIGFLHRELSLMYEVSVSTINKAIHGTAWAHVTGEPLPGLATTHQGAGDLAQKG